MGELVNIMSQIINEYYRNGYSIIPLKGKIPVIEWKKYQHQRAHFEDIFDWYLNYDSLNIGLVTGKISNLAVIDVDDLKQLPALLEKIPDLFETCRVRTPRPGYHFYFSLDGKNIKSTDKLFGMDDVELRGKGRCVVSPGTIIDGAKYVFEKPLSCIKPLPKIVIEQSEEIKSETRLPQYRGKAKCIGQILGYNIPKGQREVTYFIAYSKLLEAKNEAEYSKYVIKLANKKLSKPLPEKEIDAFNKKKIYHYSCSRINKELSFIDCFNCRVRGGLKMERISDKNYQGTLNLTTTERAVAFLLDSYWLGEQPSINEILAKTGMNFYAVKKALKGLKEKGFIE